MVLGEQRRSLMTKRSWEIIGKVWPKVIQAQHSEKPSILKLIDQIADKLHKNIESTEIAIKVGTKYSTSFLDKHFLLIIQWGH